MTDNLRGRSIKANQQKYKKGKSKEEKEKEKERKSFFP